MPKLQHYSTQNTGDAEARAILEVLQGDFLTQGPRAVRFAESVARTCGAPHAAAVSSGTAALYALAHALELSPGDEAIVSAVTFAATAAAPARLGAVVRLADLAPGCVNVDAESVAREMTPRTRAVFVTDMTGLPADWPALSALCRERGVALVEDAAHALGAVYHHEGRAIGVGACVHQDAAIFSMHPTKAITCGEGGVIVSAREDLAERARRYANHNMQRDPGEGPWAYRIDEPGENYRLSELHAAVGLAQLERLDEHLHRRRAVAARYLERLSAFNPDTLRPAVTGDAARSAWHLFVVLADFEGLGVARAKVMGRLKERGIGTQVHYMPLCMQPCFAGAGQGPARLPNAMAYYHKALSLPCHPLMEPSEADRVVSELADVLGLPESAS